MQEAAEDLLQCSVAIATLYINFIINRQHSGVK
jgi:hypothetical protein